MKPRRAAPSVLTFAIWLGSLALQGPAAAQNADVSCNGILQPFEKDPQGFDCID